MPNNRQDTLLMQTETFTPPKKRLFMGLVFGITVFCCAVSFVLWFIPYLGLKNIHPLFPVISGIIFLSLILLVGWAALSLALQTLRGRPFQGTDRVRAWGIKFFLPLAEFFGKLLGFEKDDIRRSFIKVNNELALSRAGSVCPDKMLVLLPHCIQKTACALRLTHNVDNCKRCGACPLGPLLNLRDKHGFHLAVATGGTVARRIVVSLLPELILAVACERDLSSGIQDVYPLPVYGILNERPEGPCINTRVNAEFVEKAVITFKK